MKTLFPIILLIVLVNLGCSKSELEKRDYPILITHVDVNESGADFRLELLTSGNEIIEKGFIWGSNEIGQFRIVIDPSTSVYNLRTDIPKDGEFYVRAFAKTEDYLAYGSVEQFTSKGFVRKEHLVTDFAPKNVTDLNIVKIWGAEFSWLKENINVRIDGKNATILSSTSDTIEFVLPPHINEGTHEINLFIYTEYELIQGLNIVSPEIESISSAEAHANSIITINGNYFSNNSQVFFDENLGQIQSMTENQIIVKTPNTSGTVKVTVRNSSKTSNQVDLIILNP